jgi:DNA-binding GntR family transcriptional regulator
MTARLKRVRTSAKSPRARKGVGKGNAASLAYEMLRKAILELHLAPGTDLDDGLIVRKLGISRTPVREAFVRLASDGLVVLSPNRRAQVAPISLSEFPRFVEALDLVQRAILRLAAMRRTEADLEAIRAATAAFEEATAEGDALELTSRNKAFHLSIAEASQNRYLIEQYSRLLDQGTRMMRVPFAFDPGNGYGAKEHQRKIVKEHRAMLAAVAERDADRAESLGAEHAALFRSRFIAYLEGNGAAGVSVRERE